jgi:hypothetical protein
MPENIWGETEDCPATAIAMKRTRSKRGRLRIEEREVYKKDFRIPLEPENAFGRPAKPKCDLPHVDG